MNIASTYNYTFPTALDQILKQIDIIEPKHYGKTRNFIDGAVTQLSPYISRGVISTKLIFEKLILQNVPYKNIEKLTQELAWRDYWQLVWLDKKSLINSDLKNEQSPIHNYGIPKAIVNAETNIKAIDEAIIAFYKTGYLHNHIRMYIASITCNMSFSYWQLPSKWMYYHLLDGDWASNTLSWQWVAGTNSNKKYVANQENINKYCHTNQKNTWLDIPYEMFSNFKTPQVLEETQKLELITSLPTKTTISINEQLPTVVYNYYNLDPFWLNTINANRILIFEPSHFKAYPISEKALSFALSLSKNIPNIQLFVGEFEELRKYDGVTEIHFKEHPTANHYKGILHNRDWMTDIKGYYPSFFKFWNKAKKQLEKQAKNTGQ